MSDAELLATLFVQGGNTRATCTRAFAAGLLSRFGGLAPTIAR